MSDIGKCRCGTKAKRKCWTVVAVHTEEGSTSAVKIHFCGTRCLHAATDAFIVDNSNHKEDGE